MTEEINHDECDDHGHWSNDDVELGGLCKTPCTPPAGRCGCVHCPCHGQPCVMVPRYRWIEQDGWKYLCGAEDCDDCFAVIGQTFIAAEVLVLG